MAAIREAIEKERKARAARRYAKRVARRNAAYTVHMPEQPNGHKGRVVIQEDPRLVVKGPADYKRPHPLMNFDSGATKEQK